MTAPWGVKWEVRCDIDWEMLRICTYDDLIPILGKELRARSSFQPRYGCLYIQRYGWLSVNRLGAKRVLCHCSFVVPVVDKTVD